MSDTPRTDAAVAATRKDPDAWLKMTEHAKELERELRRKECTKCLMEAVNDKRAIMLWHTCRQV